MRYLLMLHADETAFERLSDPEKLALMAEYLAEGRPESFKVAEYTVFAQQKMHARMSRYGIELKPSSTTSQINSGPGFVTPLNVDLVERYSGRFR